MQKNKSEVKELLNLIFIKINTNSYLNMALAKQKKIGQKLDSAIVKEYYDEFH